MKKINYMALSIAIAIALTGCKKEEPATIPALSTTPASNITASTAVSGGSILDDGGASVIANGVCWSINPNPSTSESKTVDGVGAAQFISNINGLSAGSTYHIRAYATNSVGTAYGADITFTTLGEAPSCLTQAATNISNNGATLNGTVNPNHISTIVTFEYGINTSYGSIVTATQSPMTGNAILNANAAITGLLPGTIYHFRIKTVNSIGTVYGEDLTFTTSGMAPTAITNDATNITGTTATLNGKVNANSISTTVTFEYGTTTSYGNNVTASSGTVTGNAETGVSYNLTGLALGTTYHFRVRAQNSVGVTYGSDKSFTTPNKPTVTTVAITDKTYNSAVSGGTIVSDGGAAITAKGVCWNTTGSPTISDSKTNEGAGNSNYTSSIIALLPNTTYYVRAYAINTYGTGYGEPLTFKTLIAPPTTGLVAYYPFNGNANDESGFGHNGIVYGPTPIPNRFGVSNSAYHFIDTDSILTSFTGVLGNAERSISFWAKINADEKGGYICHYGGGYGTSFTPAIFFMESWSADPYQAHLDISDATVTYKASQTNDGKWHHYVYVFSTTNGTSLNGIRIYQDGLLLGTIIGSYHYSLYNINTTNAHPFTFGGPDHYDNSYAVDDLRFYNRVLTGDEIQLLFHEGGW